MPKQARLSRMDELFRRAETLIWNSGKSVWYHSNRRILSMPVDQQNIIDGVMNSYEACKQAFKNSEAYEEHQ